MTNLLLREYQEKGIFATSLKFSRGILKIVFQLATGGGKTVVMSAIAARFMAKSNKKILILVHRDELLNQTIKTIYRWFEIIAFPIVAGKRIQYGHNIYVGMVETVFGCNEKLPDFDLIMMDETHIGNFKKLHALFPGKKILGFTATPILSTKKEKLKDYFEDIVCCIDTPDLILLNHEQPDQGLVQNKTYNIKNSVDRKKLSVGANGDYNEKAMGAEYSKGKNINNTLQAYLLRGEGKKAVCFNCNIDHSKLVCNAFIDAGIPSRHLDAKNGGTDESGKYFDKKAWRKDCLRWLKITPGAVLHNVGILTTGFDEPSIEVIVVNRSTMSLSLWLQMTGRGSRPYLIDGYIKKYFTIIDLGSNAATHGDWCDARDWEEIFNNPPKPSKGGVAPVKDCPECEAMISAGARSCKYCEAVFEIAPVKYDAVKIELELFTKTIDPAKLEATRKDRGYGDYYPLFQTASQICVNAKSKLKEIPLDLAMYTNLLSLFDTKAKEWYNLKNEQFTANKRKFTAQIFEREILKHFKPWDKN